MAKNIIVIGGGIIGLCSAYFLRKDGHDVTVIDRTDMLEGCSYGNAGYICPSHFVPLAAPGIVTQGLKWMMSSKSPFYVQPRLSAELIEWGLKFIKKANAQHVEASAIPLRDISLFSQRLYEDLSQTPGFSFAYEPVGLLDLFQTEANEHHAEELVKASRKLGLDADVLTKAQVEALEPGLKMNIKGAVHFKCDAQLYPNKLMRNLLDWLTENGVRLLPFHEVKAFHFQGNKINSVITDKGDFMADEFVMATGTWSRGVAAMLKINLPMVGGRGYSVTLEDSPYKVKHPIILSEARVAISSMDGNKIRFGGTMEITSLNAPMRLSRVKGILESVTRYLPDFKIDMPEKDKIWSGFRPCSPDGLPYIGRASAYQNLIIATGHSMLGLSLGAGTGKLVSEIAENRTTEIAISAFAIGRK